MEWWQRRSGANQPAGLNFQALDATGTSTVVFDLKPLTPPATATDNTWIKYSGTVTIPADVGWVRPQFKYAASGTLSGAWAFDDVVIRRQTGSTLIEENSISTGKIVANAITTELIKAEAVTAVEIKTGTITANEINTGSIKTAILTANSITTTMLQSNSITTDILAAGAITSKHTITGATIRTSASGERTEMTSQGLQQIGSDGAVQLRMGYGVDTGLAVQDPNTGNLVALTRQAFGTRFFSRANRLVVPTVAAENTFSGYVTDTFSGNWTAPASRVMAMFFTQTDSQATSQNFRVYATLDLLLNGSTSNYIRVVEDMWVAHTGNFKMAVADVAAGSPYAARTAYRSQRSFSGTGTPAVTERSVVLMPI